MARIIDQQKRILSANGFDFIAYSVVTANNSLPTNWKP